MKCVFFSRGAAPRGSSIWTKASSLPAMASASAMQASLPDCTIMPCIRSSTVTGCFGSMNMREPWRLPGALRDRHRLVARERALLQRGEGQIGRHQLGQRGRLDALVGVLRGQHLARVVVDQQPGARGQRRAACGRIWAWPARQGNSDSRKAGIAWGRRDGKRQNYTRGTADAAR